MTEKVMKAQSEPVEDSSTSAGSVEERGRAECQARRRRGAGDARSVTAMWSATRWTRQLSSLWRIT